MSDETKYISFLESLTAEQLREVALNNRQAAFEAIRRYHVMRRGALLNDDPEVAKMMAQEFENMPFAAELPDPMNYLNWFMKNHWDV